MSEFFNFIGFGAAEELKEIAPKTDDESFESGDSSFEMLDSGDESYETPEGSIASSFEKLSEDSGEEEEEDVTNFEVIAADLLTQLNDWFREDIAALIGN